MEHPAVLGACRRLEIEGVEVTYLRPDSEGVVSPDDVRAALRPDTVLITIMHANNELGTVQPIAGIAAIAREAGVLMHSDGVQAAGKIEANVRHLAVDLYSISGHKIYAPKGCGALYVRRDTRIEALFHGRSERDLRPGTDNVPGAVALGCAARNAQEALSGESARLTALRDRLEAGIRSTVPDVAVNGGRARRVPNTANICFQGIDGEALLIALDLRGFAVSTGAACSSGAVEPSHVLLATGLSAEEARSTIRFSLGKSNTAEQVDALIDAVASAVAHLRRLSPAYA
jgi:cysteine desulfurase